MGEQVEMVVEKNLPQFRGHEELTKENIINNKSGGLGCKTKTKNCFNKLTSLCPECMQRIEAELFEENGKVMIQKECQDHSSYKDIYWSDAAMYQKFNDYNFIGKGLDNPHTTSTSQCPDDCGLCNDHTTGTILANIDVTNRCNMNCPICFANANAKGYVYEPSIEQIRFMLSTLRDQRPVRCFSVQFSGGEPTVRDDLPEIIKLAYDMGFIQIQIASNGIRLAKDLEFTRELYNAGLTTIYLQFDGIKKETYEKTRGFNAFPIKEKAIENCRSVGIKSIALVPTLAKGVNDDQVGDMIRFATENLDVVKGINFQPMSFTGRVDESTREENRITIPDVVKLVEEQTDGQVGKDAWYPVPFVVPISNFIASVREGYQIPKLTCHPHCGGGTYIFVDGDKLVPVTDFVDVEGLTEYLDNVSTELEHASGVKYNLLKAKSIYKITSFIDPEKAPQNVNVYDLFKNFFTQGDINATKEFHRKTLFLGSMHFQDLYNFDVGRLQRCGIHYATPDGKLIPFCSYNPLYRDEIERKFSKPIKN